jgi:hypothetical protein
LAFALGVTMPGVLLLVPAGVFTCPGCGLSTTAPPPPPPDPPPPVAPCAIAGPASAIPNTEANMIDLVIDTISRLLRWSRSDRHQVARRIWLHDAAGAIRYFYPPPFPTCAGATGT